MKGGYINEHEHQGLISASPDKILINRSVDHDHVLLWEYFDVLCNVPFWIKLMFNWIELKIVKEHRKL